MSASLSLLFLGATTTISLVAAIGAQGTFVLRQGILGRHITPIIIFCILSDALMISLGVVGLGALLDAAPWFIEVFRYVGAAFLAWFGFEAGRRVFTPHSIVVDDAEGGSQSLKAALLTTAAVTYLNPLAWLDTTILLGSLANAQGDPGRWWYYLGCWCGSLIWFFDVGLWFAPVASALCAPFSVACFGWCDGSSDGVPGVQPADDEPVDSLAFIPPDLPPYALSVDFSVLFSSSRGMSTSFLGMVSRPR